MSFLPRAGLALTATLFALLSAGTAAAAIPAGSVTEFSAGIGGAAGLGSVAAGPDGNVWFVEATQNRIGRITPSGVVTEFTTGITAGAAPASIVAGPDGNMWFTESGGNQIGRITPQGIVTEFPVLTATAGLRSIASGPDGNLWFAESAGNNIGRITTAGVVSEFPLLTASSSPTGIAAGPDGNVWFTAAAAAASEESRRLESSRNSPRGLRLVPLRLASPRVPMGISGLPRADPPASLGYSRVLRTQ